MHFTGTIWRPPYEAASLLIEATAGCTHHRCKFCTLYNDLPFPFRMSPLEDIEADLLEAQTALHSPMGKLTAALQGLPVREGPDRAFLTGANPFVLRTSRLLEIARLIGQYFPAIQTIGSFARITDIGLKTDGELEQLRAAGYDGLTIGVETGDSRSLAFMDKGYTPEDILTQCRRLDRAGIGYNFFYLTGIAGAGQGERSARASAELFNQLHPRLIGSSMLTVYPDSRLYQEIQAGNWREAGEVEKYGELKTLVSHLDIPVIFAALGASNAYQFQGRLPEEWDNLLTILGALYRLMAAQADGSKNRLSAMRAVGTQMEALAKEITAIRQLLERQEQAGKKNGHWHLPRVTLPQPRLVWLWAIPILLGLWVMWYSGAAIWNNLLMPLSQLLQ